MNWLNATVVVVSFCVVGCGTSEPPVNTKNPVEEKLAAGKEDLKKMLGSYPTEATATVSVTR